MWARVNGPVTWSHVRDQQVYLFLFKYLRTREKDPPTSLRHCETSTGKDPSKI